MPQQGGGSGGDEEAPQGGGGSGGGPSGFDLGDLLDGTGSGSSSGSPSGSSSGGSSSGGSSSPAAPIDPNILQGARDYYEIWGVAAPTGYIENLVLKQGMNRFEIVEYEMSKPRAQTTVFYRDKYSYYANTAARIFGRR